jgi:hypothetical protein
MSSPGARQRRRRQQYQTPRDRRELVTAIGAGVAIVLATVLMIWLLRPGGLADRQPRSSWLVGIVVMASVLAVYTILRPASKVKISRNVALGGSFGVIVVGAVLGGVFWPGGVVRHTPTIATIPSGTTAALTVPTLAPIPTTTVPGSPSSTTATTAPTSTSSAAPSSSSTTSP